MWNQKYGQINLAVSLWLAKLSVHKNAGRREEVSFPVVWICVNTARSTY